MSKGKWEPVKFKDIAVGDRLKVVTTSNGNKVKGTVTEAGWDADWGTFVKMQGYLFIQSDTLIGYKFYKKESK